MEGKKEFSPYKPYDKNWLPRIESSLLGNSGFQIKLWGWNEDSHSLENSNKTCWKALRDHFRILFLVKSHKPPHPQFLTQVPTESKVPSLKPGHVVKPGNSNSEKFHAPKLLPKFHSIVYTLYPFPTTNWLLLKNEAYHGMSWNGLQLEPLLM